MKPKMLRVTSAVSWKCGREGRSGFCNAEGHPLWESLCGSKRHPDGLGRIPKVKETLARLRRVARRDGSACAVLEGFTGLWLVAKILDRGILRGTAIQVMPLPRSM